MPTRTMLLGGAATLALAAGSVAAIAATGQAVHTNAHRMDRVATSCAAPASLPGQRVTVMLADTGGVGSMMNRGSMMGGHAGSMMLRPVPNTLRAGTVSFVAINHGARTHELVVLPLSAGAAVGARPVDVNDTVSEAGSLGEASSSCGQGPGDGVRPGASSWLTLTLTPGRYELLCNLPGHYAAGMYAELDVG